MIPMRAIVVAALVATLFRVHVISSSGPVDFNNPVRSADEDEVKYSSGGENAFKFYAGYLKAHDDGEPEQFLYYWFVESESSPATKPVVLGLNGGPGSSSLINAVANNGPMGLSEVEAPTPRKKKYSWTKLANMLYIEGPVGVGFSYGNLPRNYESTDSTTARANYLAMKSFMQKFPHFASNPLYLTGVSYAGVYVPTLAALIDKDYEFNLRGIAIENGIFAQDVSDFALNIFGYYYGLIGETKWHALSRACCDGRTPSRANCNYRDATADTRCKRTITSIAIDMKFIFDEIQRYNIYGTPKLNLLVSDVGHLSDNLHLSPQSEQVNRNCIPRNTQPLDLTTTAREILHVPSGWRPNRSITYCKQFLDWPRGVANNMTQLIESDRELKILVFNGDTDIVCNYLGTKWFLEDLGRRNTSEYTGWKINDKLAGFVQHFDGFTFATALGSGHTPASSNPETGFKIFQSFLATEKGKPVELL